ncbi:MAG: TIR domain-containing protein [Acidocella sp.]|nr:TIR domain-containing protein [Acidocella sp.]
MAHDVFISYAKQDKPVADAVCAVLEADHIRCWIAPRDILPSADWGESIIEALASAHAMVLVFSAWANASPQVKREVERAVHLGIPIIPLRIEDVEPTKSLEFFLSMPHWLDAFTEPMERHLQYLVEVLQRVLNGPPRTVSQPNGDAPEVSHYNEHAQPSTPVETPPPAPPPVDPVKPVEQPKSPITVLEPVTEISHFETQISQSAPKPAEAPRNAPANDRLRDNTSLSEVAQPKPSRRGLLIAAAGVGAAAVGSSNTHITLWDIANGNQIRTLSGHTKVVESVAFSPNGTTLASGSDDFTIKLWNVSSGTVTNTMSGHTGKVFCVAYSPDGNTLASASDDQTVKLWDVS